MARLQETAREKRQVYHEKWIWDCFIKGCKNEKKKQLTVPSEAAGAAAFERALLLVAPQQLRSSALRFLHVDENPGEAANPAVLVIRSRGAPRLGAPQQTQDGEDPPCGVHGAQFKSKHVNSSPGADMSDGQDLRLLWSYW